MFDGRRGLVSATFFLWSVLHATAFAWSDAGAFSLAQAGADSAVVPPAVREGKCDSCHRFSPGASKDVGPDLFFAGDKFQREWLLAYLQKPEIIRKAGYITDPGFLRGEPTVTNPHQGLSPAKAAAIADYLMTLKLPGFSKEVDSEPLSKGNRARLKILFERDYGCSACHETINLAGKIHGGVSGPSLIDAGNRLTADWIFHWLKTPEKFLDKGRMPVFQLADDATVQITKYLMTMKKENLK